MRGTRRQAITELLAAAASAGLVGRAFADTPLPGALAPTKPPPTTLPPATPSEADPATRIDADRDPFEHVIAPVMLNGQGPFRFLVDTGANASCVSRKLAQALALPMAERRAMHTVVGVKSQPTAVIDELRVGERIRRRVSALVIPLVDADLDGVLAVDWLKGQRLTLDFANKSLQFDASRRETSQIGRVVVPARRRLGQLTIVDADLGESRVSAMIDSGSQVSLCNSALMSKLDKSATRAGGGPAKRYMMQMISIVGERFAGELVYLPFLRIASLQLGNVPVVHADEHVFEIWGLADTPAILLGMDLLRQFRAVSLDFGRSQVRFDLINL